MFKNVIARIRALITADNKDFKKKMKETKSESKKTGKDVSGSFKGMEKAIRAAATGILVVITTKIIKGLHSLVKEMGLVSLKANAVFGAYRKEIDQMARDTSASMGLTEKQFVTAAAGIQDLLIPIGFARKEATGMTKDTMKLAGALSAWTGGLYNAKEVGDIFAKAILGEREQLKSLGIAISEAEVQQRLMEKGQKGLTGQALAQAKAQATLELITEKSTDAQTAFKDGQDNIVITSAQVKANIKGIADDLATVFSPSMENATGLVNEFTSQLKEVTGSWAEVSHNNLGFFKKLQYALAGATGGFAKMVIQNNILDDKVQITQKRMQGLVDHIIDLGGSLDDVGRSFAIYGKDVVFQAKAYFQQQQSLLEKDIEETKIKEAEAYRNRIKAQKDFYWALEMALWEHMKAVKDALDTDMPEQKGVFSGVNKELEGYQTNLGLAIAQFPAFTGAIQATTTAAQQQADQAELLAYQWEQIGKQALATVAEAAIEASRAFIQSSIDSESSFRDMARAAVESAKRVISAKIAEGITAQVESALSTIPFPFGLIAAAAAGAAAGALFNRLIPSFAEGGVTNGPTLAMIGDNPSGREYIIPSEKMGNGGIGEFYGVLKGTDMYIQQKRQSDKLKRVGRS